MKDFEKLMVQAAHVHKGDDRNILYDMIDDMLLLGMVADMQRESMILTAAGYMAKRDMLTHASALSRVVEGVLDKWEGLTLPETGA